MLLRHQFAPYCATGYSKRSGRSEFGVVSPGNHLVTVVVFRADGPGNKIEQGSGSLLLTTTLQIMNTSTVRGDLVTLPRLLSVKTKGLCAWSFFALSAIFVLSTTASKSQAAIAYDEAVWGDLSNSGLAPTTIAINPGWNEVHGTTGRTGAVVDRDYFTFTVPANYVVSSFDELAGTQIGGAVSFIGLEWGPQLTLPTNTTTAAGLLGWTHYAATSTNIDLLPFLAVPSDGSTGFTGPLGAGTYSVWIQDFNPAPINYGFAVQLSGVPEPSTYGLFAIGALGAIVLARRKFQKKVE